MPAIFGDEQCQDEVVNCQKPTIQPISKKEIGRLQREDPNIGKVIHFMTSGQRPLKQEKTKQTPEVKALLRE